jgi:hypothetical protein
MLLTTPRSLNNPIITAGKRKVIRNNKTRNAFRDPGVIGYREVGNKNASNVNK